MDLMDERRNEVIVEVAERLWKAQFSGQVCVAPSEDYPKFDVAAAYAVQNQLIQWRQTKRGLAGPRANRVGHKIGLTSDAIQSWLGVSEPDFGVLLDDMVVLDGRSACCERLLQPRVEAEVAFVLGSDLAGPGVTAADVVSATDHILPALEIIDSRIADWKITYEDTIADNASSGMFVLGNRPRILKDVDLRLAGMALRKNGDVVSTGAGAACLGHPINAVVWLVNKLAGFDQKLEAGSVILSGALGPVCDVEPGDWVRGDIAGLGSVSVRFQG